MIRQTKAGSGTWMRRLSLGLLACALVMVLGLALVRWHEQGLVYSVAEVQAGLRADPAHWANRTVLIRGQDVQIGLLCSDHTVPAGAAGRRHDVTRTACFPNQYTQDVLSDVPDPRQTGNGHGVASPPSLMITRRDAARVPGVSAPNAIAVWLAHLPVIGRLVPADWLEPSAVYHVRLLMPHRCPPPVRPRVRSPYDPPVSPYIPLPCPQGILQ